MLRGLRSRFTRRQVAVLGALALLQAAAVALGAFGIEAAAWGGLAVGNLAVAVLCIRNGNRFARFAAEAQQERPAPPESRPVDELDEQRSEVLMRRVLAAIEQERHANARRFAELAGVDASTVDVGAADHESA